MARYVITVDAADEAGLDRWLESHSVLTLRSTGGTHSWRVVSVQRQEPRPARPERDTWTAGTTLVRLLADDSQHSAALSFGGTGEGR